MHDSPIKLICLVRSSPFVPFNVCNYWIGACGRFTALHVVLGHLCTIPLSFVWVGVGGAILKARLVARLEAIWAGYAEARRLDPDPESWIQTLEFASGPLFIDWCHTLCCEVLGEPIDRLPTDDGSGDEHWFSLAADDLAAHLQAVLRGEGAFSPQDPIRVPWRRSA